MTGTVIEAELDRGRGPVATVLLITDGTLNRGDVILAGGAYGKVRAMRLRGQSLEKAGSSTPVLIIGLNDVPSAGDPVHVVKDLEEGARDRRHA